MMFLSETRIETRRRCAEAGCGRRASALDAYSSRTCRPRLRVRKPAIGYAQACDRLPRAQVAYMTGLNGSLIAHIKSHSEGAATAITIAAGAQLTKSSVDEW